MNQLVDGNQGVLVGAVLPLVRCCDADWHLLFFSPQEPHSRRVLRETRQGRQLFNFLHLLGSYAKSHWYPFGLAAVPVAGVGVAAVGAATVPVILLSDPETFSSL